MTLTSSPDRPQPLARIVGAVADWVGRLGEIWVEAQVIEIKRRAAPTQFLTLRDRFADVSCSVTTTASCWIRRARCRRGRRCGCA